MTRSTLSLPANPEASSESDERVRRSGDLADRGERGYREDADRQGDGLLSDDAFERLMQDEFSQTALPVPPTLPGFHLCWLTTNSRDDGIQKRQRIGYLPVQRAEMPGFDPSNGHDLAEFAGYVTCNEMVLHKIPERYYQRMMHLFHHKSPLESESSIRESAREHDALSGASPGEIDGFNEMERSVKRNSKREPVFRS